MNVNKQLVAGIAAALALVVGPKQAHALVADAQNQRFAAVAPANNCRGGSNGPGGNAIIAGALITPAYVQARAFLGTTPDEIQQKFAAVQEMNFASGNTKLIISKLSNKELAAIAFHYDKSAVSGEGDLLQILSQRLDATALLRVANAFGRETTKEAVETFAPANVKREFESRLAASPDIQGYEGQANAVDALPMAGPAPTLDMTLQEIYLEYRTAPIGSLSPGAALVETTLFAGTALYWSWKAGYAFGTVIYQDIIVPFVPQFADVLGGTIYSAVQNIAIAKTEYLQGNYEAAADSLFGYDLQDTGSYYGDWNVGESYANFEFTNNSCH